MVCSFTGISIAISYALCVVYVTIAEAIFDVTASTITLELIIYGIKEMIISVILGSVLSLFPYIIGTSSDRCIFENCNSSNHCLVGSKIDINK